MRFNLKKILLIGLVTFTLVAQAQVMKDNNPIHSPVDMVNPHMGNISHMLVPTFPTIHLPNSLLRVYPERRDFTGDRLNGLPLIVTSHRGSSAFNLSVYQGEITDLKPVMSYSYDNEKITPYSYEVYLDEQQIQVKYGLSHQSALYEIEYKKEEETFVVLNSKRGALKWDGEAISGYQIIANNTKVYLYLVPSEMPESISIIENGAIKEGKKAAGKNACLVLKYAKGTKKSNLSYGVSFIDEQQAKANMKREVFGKTITEIQATAKDIWNNALGKIKITGGTENNQTVFYTSLYRCYERPICISEDGRYYSAFDGKIHEDNDRPFYTDDWIWDSYRAHHPLRVLVDGPKEEDILNSFILMADQMDNFWMPTFPEITGDSRRMNSNHGVASVIDGYRKGLRNFDLGLAYEASKGAISDKTLAPWSGKPAGWLDTFYKEHGYIPALGNNEEETVPEVNGFEKRQPVAVTLGTAYDQWCLSQIAQELGKDEEHDYFFKQSFNYRKLFNPKTGFFHPKDKNGNFIEPFDYVFSGGQGARNYYGENNAWTYRWDVQHNIADLIQLMKGPDNFIANLESMFSQPLGRSKHEFYNQLPDQTGNVGQFSMANEPSLHIPYLYNYAGQPWKTQKRIHSLINTWFRNDLMGVPGDEDGGGMSAFVVFSQLGFYPVTPGIPAYNIGSPFFKSSTIQLGKGKVFKIIANNYSEENKYIQSVQLNGKEWDKPWFTHDDIKEGGTLELYMGKKANKLWGSTPKSAPPSALGLN